jgi:hypothetical protein
VILLPVESMHVAYTVETKAAGTESRNGSSYGSASSKMFRLFPNQALATLIFSKSLRSKHCVRHTNGNESNQLLEK